MNNNNDNKGGIAPPHPGSGIVPDETESLDAASLGIAGLEFEPSLPDPLSYPGANFVTLAGGNEIIPQDAWKSTNQNDEFKFEVTKNFDGALTRIENSTAISPNNSSALFSITTGPRLSEDTTANNAVVSRQADYQVKLDFKQEIKKEIKIIISIEGSNGTTFQEETIQTTTNNFDANSVLGLQGHDLTRITGVTVRLEAANLIMATLDSIKVDKKERQGSSFEPLVEIQKFVRYDTSTNVKQSVEFRGTISDPNISFQGRTIYRIQFNFDPPRPTGNPGSSDPENFEVNLFSELEEDTITKTFTIANESVIEFEGEKNIGKITEVSVSDIPSGTILQSIDVGRRQARRGSRFGPFETFELERVNFLPDADADAMQKSVYTSILSSFEGDGASKDDPPPPPAVDLDDVFGFYQKTYDSANFEVLLNAVASSKSTLAYGLLVREPPKSANTDDPTSNTALSNGSFCLFVEPFESAFAIYTSLNGREKKNKIKLTSVKNSDQLKITREKGGIFKGYFNGILIGEETSKSSIDVLNDTLVQDQTNVQPERLGERKKVNVFQLGAVVFAPPPVTDGNSTILAHSTVDFSAYPVISLKDRLFSIVELYTLSLFYGRYGLGRTINTFTLLPGESTTIELSSTRTSTDETSKTTNVFEKVDSSSKSELEKSVEQENSSSSEESSAQSASVSASASGGFFGVSFSVSASASTSQSSARSELARSVSGAVSNQASEFSSERTIEANSTENTKVDDTKSSALKRELQNLSNNRTLNFVFRQLNQEFISILHLVDIRIGLFGADDSVRDASVDGAEAFIRRYVSADLVKDVYEQFIKKIRFVDDYQGNRADVLVKRIASESDLPFDTKNLLKGQGTIDEEDKENTFGKSEKESTIAFKSTQGVGGLNEEFIIASDLEPIKDIPGVIIKADRYVVRTEGVATEAILGNGDALDDYGINLQVEDIKNQKANTRILEAKGDLLLLQKDIMNATDNEGVRIKYLKYFNFLEDGNQRNSINTRSDFDAFIWLWFSKVWSSPAIRAGVAFCFIILIYYSLTYWTLLF